jgi:hypothetical protein
MQGEIDDVLQSASGVRTPKYTVASGLYFIQVGMNYREAIFSFSMKDIPGTKVDDGLRNKPTLLR